MIQSWDRRILTRIEAAQAQTQRQLGVIERQIAAHAARLTITTGTAANHVEQILRRLGFRSRTQLATWAAECGLYRSGSIR